MGKRPGLAITAKGQATLRQKHRAIENLMRTHGYSRKTATSVMGRAVAAKTAGGAKLKTIPGRKIPKKYRGRKK